MTCQLGTTSRCTPSVPRGRGARLDPGGASRAGAKAMMSDVGESRRPTTEKTDDIRLVAGST